MSTTTTNTTSVSITTTGTCTGCCENSTDPCCGTGGLNDDLYLTLASPTCGDLDGMIIHLTRTYVLGLPTTNWTYASDSGGTGNCANVTSCSFNCSTKSISGVWDVDNIFSGTSSDTIDCDAFSLTYAFTTANGVGAVCCTATDVTGTLTE